MPTPSTLTLHSLELTDNREIAPGLYAARDIDGFLRTHNGEHFRGYTRTGWNRKRELRFGVSCWGPTAGRHERTHAWKTRAGAERALILHSIRLNS